MKPAVCECGKTQTTSFRYVECPECKTTICASIRDIEYTDDELDWLFDYATMLDYEDNDQDGRSSRKDVGNWFHKGDTPPTLVLGVRTAVEAGLSLGEAQDAVLVGWGAAREESGN